ncbi:MAG: SgcJ/EcaC family oxidoreductase [Micropruina sp.]|nr:SgcJ/EcaC family oxidoreductase [Micropruina sp.]
MDLITAFVKAWDEGDAEAIGDLFVEDADFVNVVGLWWNSRISIVRAHAYGFERIFPNSKLTLEKLSQRRLGDDVAVVHGRWMISGQVDPEGLPVEPRRGVISAVVTRLEDGTWIGVSAHNTDVAVAADTFVSRGGKLTATSYIEAPSSADPAGPEVGGD